MAPAVELIDDAGDLSEEGKVDEAVEKYRQALQELDRIELENPDRVDKPEFATVRNKRAYVNAAIDSLHLTQARQNAKAVAITDTDDLEKRYARKMGKLKKGVEVEGEEEKLKGKGEVEGKIEGGEEKEEVDEDLKPEEAKEEVNEEKVEPVRDRKTLDRKAKLKLASQDLNSGDYEAAKLLVRELLNEKPNDLSAMLMKAAIETNEGDYRSAEKTIDRAIQSNPRAYQSYYNMARLFLRTRGDAGKDAARRYYDTGRAYGGPVDAALEGALK